MGLWERIFGGAPNRDLTPNLRDLLALAALEVFALASTTVCSLIEKGDHPHELGTDPDTFNDNAWNLLLEFTGLNIHLVERIAGQTLDADTRSRFMDQLVEDVSENLARAVLRHKSKASRRAFEDHFVSVYQERSQLYTPLPHSSGRGGIFWEAAAMIANTYFPNDASREALLLPATIMAAYHDLNVALRPGLAAARGTDI